MDLSEGDTIRIDGERFDVTVADAEESRYTLRPRDTNGSATIAPTT
jgi:hypothetical protein